MHNLTSTAGIVAMGAGAVALLALLLCGVMALKLRRVRSAQRSVLGGQNRDLVTHTASLQGQFESLCDYVQEAVQRLDQRVETTEGRIDGTLAYHALVHYDAYGEMSGRQSTSIALLDANRSGIVLSSIHHRDQARLYAKEVHDGKPELELSPEEGEAIQRALEAGARQPSG